MGILRNLTLQNSDATVEELQIIGCAMKVHNTLGNGFQEVIYQRALALNNVHLAQAINYLEAYQLHISLLLNFRAKSLQFKRLISRIFLVSSYGIVYLVNH